MLLEDAACTFRDRGGELANGATLVEEDLALLVRKVGPELGKRDHADVDDLAFPIEEPPVLARLLVPRGHGARRALGNHASPIAKRASHQPVPVNRKANETRGFRPRSSSARGAGARPGA